MTQTELPLYRRHFAGPEYRTMADHHRLDSQHLRVKETMRDGHWRTLIEISELTGDPTPSISAQLRFLRSPGFGGHTVEKRPRGNRDHGLFEYRLVMNPATIKNPQANWLREEARKGL